MPSLALTDRFASDPGFDALHRAMGEAPLHEAMPERPGDGVAALGFAFALATGWQGAVGIVAVTAQTWAAEEGTLSPRGLAAFGVPPSALIAVHARTGQEALWAAEQALEAPGVAVVCALADRDVDLTASRRLLLKAERNGARAILVRAGAGASSPASAAFTRWRLAAVSSQAPSRLVGLPSWRATLSRRRGGASGAVFDLQWNPHERAFVSRRTLAGDLVAPSADRPAAARASRAA